MSGDEGNADEKTVNQTAAYHITKLFSEGTQEILYAGEYQPEKLWANELEEKLKFLAKAAEEKAQAEVKGDDQVDAEVASQVTLKRVREESFKRENNVELNASAALDDAFETSARAKIKAEDRAKLRANSQKYFLASVMTQTLDPYYVQLNEAEQRVRGADGRKIPAEKTKIEAKVRAEFRADLDKKIRPFHGPAFRTANTMTGKNLKGTSKKEAAIEYAESELKVDVDARLVEAEDDINREIESRLEFYKKKKERSARRDVTDQLKGERIKQLKEERAAAYVKALEYEDWRDVYSEMAQAETIFKSRSGAADMGNWLKSSEVSEKRERRVVNLLKSRMAEAIRSDPEVIEINENIKRVKQAINRGLQSYNKSDEGREKPFLPRIVALSNRAGGFFQDFFSEAQTEGWDQETFEKELEERNKSLHAFYLSLSEDGRCQFYQFKDAQDSEAYRQYLQLLSTEVLQEELEYTTHLRQSFVLRIAAEREKIIRELGDAYSEANKEAVSRQAITNILVTSYREEANRVCNKSYILVGYEDQELLAKAKKKWKKHLNFWLRAVISFVVGMMEGLVAGYAIYGLLVSMLGPFSIIPLVIGIFVGIAGAAANMPTLFNEGQQPFKNLFNGHLLGEPGDKLKGTERKLAIGLIVSTCGYGAALGIFGVAALMAVATALLGPLLPLAILITIGCIAVFSSVSITMMFLNVATNFVKKGGMQKIKKLYNFTKIKREFFENNPNMPTAAKWAAFLFFKVFMEKIVGTVAIVMTFYGFSLSTGSDGLDFASRVNASAMVGYVMGVTAVILSIFIFNVFTYDKLCFVYNAIKNAFSGQAGIFYHDENQKLHFSGENLGKVLVKMANSLALVTVKLLVFSVAASLILACSIFALIFVGLPIALVRGVGSAVSKKYKAKLERDKIDNHEVHAVGQRTSNSAIKQVFSFMLAIFGVANGVGQGALASRVALTDNPCGLDAGLNAVAGATAFGVSTVTSAILNGVGCEEALTNSLGKDSVVKSEQPGSFSQEQAKKWTDFGTVVKHLAFAIAHLFVKHGRVQEQKQLATDVGLLKAPPELPAPDNDIASAPGNDIAVVANAVGW